MILPEQMSNDTDQAHTEPLLHMSAQKLRLHISASLTQAAICTSSSLVGCALMIKLLYDNETPLCFGCTSMRWHS